MRARSAALALVRDEGGQRQVLLVHPGGPFWAKKHLGAWSLPKGELDPGEAPLAAAKREFEEETGGNAPPGPYVELGEVTLKSGKRVVGFGVRGDFDPSALRSNELELEHPAGSGRRVRFPEVDQAVWATLDEARRLVNVGQLPLVERAFSLVA